MDRPSAAAVRLNFARYSRQSASSSSTMWDFASSQGSSQQLTPGSGTKTFGSNRGGEWIQLKEPGQLVLLCDRADVQAVLCDEADQQPNSQISFSPVDAGVSVQRAPDSAYSGPVLSVMLKPSHGDLYEQEKVVLSKAHCAIHSVKCVVRHPIVGFDISCETMHEHRRNGKYRFQVKCYPHLWGGVLQFLRLLGRFMAVKNISAAPSAVSLAESQPSSTSTSMPSSSSTSASSTSSADTADSSFISYTAHWSASPTATRLLSSTSVPSERTSQAATMSVSERTTGDGSFATMSRISAVSTANLSPISQAGTMSSSATSQNCHHSRGATEDKPFESGERGSIRNRSSGVRYGMSDVASLSSVQTPLLTRSASVTLPLSERSSSAQEFRTGAASENRSSTWEVDHQLASTTSKRNLQDAAILEDDTDRRDRHASRQRYHPDDGRLAPQGDPFDMMVMRGDSGNQASTNDHQYLEEGKGDVRPQKRTCTSDEVPLWAQDGMNRTAESSRLLTEIACESESATSAPSAMSPDLMVRLRGKQAQRVAPFETDVVDRRPGPADESGAAPSAQTYRSHATMNWVDSVDDATFLDAISGCLDHPMFPRFVERVEMLLKGHPHRNLPLS